MNEATKELTLADFQQQVAEKYGWLKFDLMIGSNPFANQIKLSDEAAKLYASYCREQGAIQGFKNGYGSCGSHLEKSFNDGFEQGKQEGEAKIPSLTEDEKYIIGKYNFPIDEEELNNMNITDFHDLSNVGLRILNIIFSNR